jgi:hypothetical protein
MINGEEDVSGIQNNCYWPLHSESIANVNTICRRSWYIATNIWKIYDFKIEASIYFIEFGTALTTILPMLFQYCYKYCYSDSRSGSKCICFNDLKIKQATFADILVQFSLTQLYRYTSDIFPFTTSTFKYTVGIRLNIPGPLRQIGQEYKTWIKKT